MAPKVLGSDSKTRLKFRFLGGISKKGGGAIVQAGPGAPGQAEVLHFTIDNITWFRFTVPGAVLKKKKRKEKKRGGVLWFGGYCAVGLRSPRSALPHTRLRSPRSTLPHTRRDLGATVPGVYRGRCLPLSH